MKQLQCTRSRIILCISCVSCANKRFPAARRSVLHTAIAGSFRQDYDKQIMLVKEPDHRLSAPDTIAAYQHRLNALGSRQAGHLCGIALGGLKYLILQGESDTVRLQAVKL